MANTSPTPQGVFDFLSEQSRDVLESYLGIDKLEVVPAESSDLPFNQRLAVILISGPTLRVTFKVHYWRQDSKAFLAIREQRPANELSDSKADGYMKEFCNVFAGKIKKLLLARDFTVGQSLPLTLEGYQQLFFTAHRRMISHCWNVLVGGATLCLSLEIEPLEDDVLEKLSDITVDTKLEDDEPDIELF